MTQAIKETYLDSYFMAGNAEADTEEAYVRSCEEDGEILWVIYDGRGDKIGHASSREMALAVASQNDFMPVNVN